MTIVYVVSARLNFAKMAPVVAELRRRMPDRRQVIVHTGQRYPQSMGRRA